MIRLSVEQGRWLLRLGEEAAQMPPTTNAMMMLGLARIVSAQINTPTHFDDLVDAIVKMVLDPRTTSLNSSRLEVLRRAVLSPLELAKFNTEVKRAQQCTGCGQPFHGYEAITIVDRNLFCHSCMHAELVTCRSCNDTVSIDLRKTISKTLEKHTCVPAEERELDAAMEPLDSAPAPAPPSPRYDGGIPTGDRIVYASASTGPQPTFTITRTAPPRDRLISWDVETPVEAMSNSGDLNRG